MSTEPKPPKPMPSVAEINAYLEQSAARTKLRLPLAKGAMIVPPPAAPVEASNPGAAANPAKAGSRALPVQGGKKLPTQRSEAQRPEAGAAAPQAPLAPAERRAEDGANPEGWRPFPGDDER